MKKLILSILLIIAALALSIPVGCVEDDPTDIPLGESLDPTIVADGLEDFSEKLQNLKSDEIEVFYHKYEIPGTYERVLERIDSGKDVVYIPDIGLKEMKLYMFIMSYNPDYKTGRSQKYGIVLHENDEIGLESRCSFTYNNTTCSIGYDDTDFNANKEITLYDKKISYSAYPSYSTLYFESDGEKLGIIIRKQLTEDEIKSLPRGMFYPLAISITDIKNGDYSAVSDSIELDVDEPKESYDVEYIEK